MTWNIYFFVLAILMSPCLTEDYGSIDDIPIESYNHGDHQENDMDLELLPERHGRSFSSDEDPKEYFFRSMRSFDDLDDVRSLGPYQNIPRPSFQTSGYSEDRKKRSAPASFVLNKSDKSVSGIVKNLGEPLEIVPLDTRNLTEKEDKAESRIAVENVEVNEDFSINDFIRFRRSADDNLEKESKSHESDQKNTNPRSEKLIMEAPNEDINREARGATKEHWVKQVYPVRKSDEISFDDNIPSSSENVRAPRVHFVTQKFTDSGLAATDVRPYEREPRARHLDREPSRSYPRDIARENPYYERRFRTYAHPGERDRPFFRDELNSRYDSRDYRDVYRPRYEHYDRIRNDYDSTQKPQKRIIYYATLPEVSRSPPNVDLRDRYRYDRDRYDDRYLSDPYRFRKSYPKSRYEDEGKTPYPVKVLTDVNVREVKKNPERRIYSEVDRTRYAYNTPPYRAADG